MDKNQSANAGYTGLIPRLGRFHMPRATKPTHPNYEPASLEPVFHNKRSHLLLGTTRESPWTAMKTQRNQK